MLHVNYGGSIKPKKLSEHARLSGNSEGVWASAEKYIECNLPVELSQLCRINLFAVDMSSLTKKGLHLSNLSVRFGHNTIV
jgi:hypothetical protein